MKQRYKKDFRGVIFDLDGTLLDSLEDLANATNVALLASGYRTHQVSAYRHFVGSGLEALIRRALPDGEPERISQTGIDALMQLTGAAYEQDLTAKSHPYPEIPELLHRLRERGIPMGVVTNKPHTWTERLVTSTFSDTDFVFIQGAMEGVPRKPDPTAALLCASHMGLPPETIAFLGDSDVDIFTAHNAGMGKLGASWGFRGEDELWSAGAESVLRTPLELLELMRRSEEGGGDGGI